MSSDDRDIQQGHSFLIETQRLFLTNHNVVKIEHCPRVSFLDFDDKVLDLLQDRVYFEKHRDKILVDINFYSQHSMIHLHAFGTSLFVGYDEEICIRRVRNSQRRTMLHWARHNSIIIDQRPDFSPGKERRMPQKIASPELPDNVIKILF